MKLISLILQGQMLRQQLISVVISTYGSNRDNRPGKSWKGYSIHSLHYALSKIDEEASRLKSISS
jgi:hypothetical protein